MKLYTTLLALLITNFSYGQESFTVSKIEKLDIKGYNVQFSPEGNKLLYTSNNFKGLKLYDISQKSIKEISNEAGAGYEPVIINDDVVFKTKAKSNQIQIFNIPSGKQTLLDKSLNTESPQSYALSQQKSKSSTILSARASDDLNGIELLNSAGNITLIAPLGDKVDYINISLYNEKLLFRVSGLGSYVIDLEGNIIKELGDVEFPRWINNKTVLYTITKDDGYQYLSSKLYISSIGDDSKPKLISTPNHIVLYPNYNARQNRIAFNTQKGDVVLVYLK